MARPSDPNARQRILDAARHEFMSKGLDGARVEDIARAAQLSKGAFYLHFESKEQLFDELVLGVAEGLERLLGEMGEQLHEVLGTPEQWLECCLLQDLRVFEFIRQHRGMFALMLEGGGSSRHSHLIESFAQRTERLVATALGMAIHAGLYRADLDVKATAAFIAGGYDRVARHLVNDVLRLHDPEFDLAAYLSKVVRQVVCGIGTPLLTGAIAQCLPRAFGSQGLTAQPSPDAAAPTIHCNVSDRVDAQPQTGVLPAKQSAALESAALSSGLSGSVPSVRTS